MVADNDTGVTFDDVAGCDEAKYELQEVVDFLKNPGRYTVLGARSPRGSCWSGRRERAKRCWPAPWPARPASPSSPSAAANSSRCSWASGPPASATSSSRPRPGPCIVFIDELDAIGRERGVHLGPVNDEREQTLNQLLVEMDGFQANVGRDPAGGHQPARSARPCVVASRAFRPPGRGRSPDMEGRVAILKVHARGKPLAADTDSGDRPGTPGLSGPTWPTLNEAALMAARTRKRKSPSRPGRRGGEVRRPRAKEPAAGREGKAPRRLSRGGSCPRRHLQPARRPSPQDQRRPPRPGARLYAATPRAERFLLTRSELLDRIKGHVGGRAAEEVVFDEISTGDENDLDHATSSPSTWSASTA